MQDYQHEFLAFAHEREVLCFGEFTLKSGRVSPYFFNAGLFHTGSDLHRLGRFYARAVMDSGLDFDLVFGPAYKGIPLATVTAASLAADHDRDLPWCFNRKEAKDHGEGGNLVGAPMKGRRVLIVDDVITAGTAIGEAVEIIRAAGGTPAGVVIALDRQEAGPDGRSAVARVREDYGLGVTSIVGLDHLLEWLEAEPSLSDYRDRVADYRRTWGAGSD